MKFVHFVGRVNAERITVRRKISAAWERMQPFGRNKWYVQGKEFLRSKTTTITRGALRLASHSARAQFSNFTGCQRQECKLLKRFV